MIDYRDLLMKYIAHVGELEGTNYIRHIGNESYRNPVKFTPEEKAELGRLDDESIKFVVD
jgi:hypothetical protein